MKYASIAGLFAALPFAVACGGDVEGPGGAGGTGTTTFTYTVQPKADGAFFFTTIQDDPVKCTVAGHTAKVGDVDATTKGKVVVDGDGGTHVDCSTEGTGPFVVHAKLDDTANSGNYLELLIPTLPTSASAATPAKGSVILATPKTATTYTGNDCEFYFEGGPQTVASGRVWVSFHCAGVSSGQSTCAVPTGYAIFENCLAL